MNIYRKVVPFKLKNNHFQKENKLKNGKYMNKYYKFLKILDENFNVSSAISGYESLPKRVIKKKKRKLKINEPTTNCPRVKLLD